MNKLNQVNQKSYANSMYPEGEYHYLDPVIHSATNPLLRGLLNVSDENLSEKKAGHLSIPFQFTRALDRGDYTLVLNFLWSKTGMNIEKRDKRQLNRVFDIYMEFMGDNSFKLNERDLELLCSIKKVLILFELENTDAKNTEFLKERVREQIQGERPLSELLGGPFVLSIMAPDSDIPFFSDELLSAYREVLEGLSRERAEILHNRQLEFYREIAPEDSQTRLSLRKLEEISA